MKKILTLHVLFVIALLTACEKNDIDSNSRKFTVNYFFDVNKPETWQYIFSIAKSNDGSIMYSAFTRPNFEEDGSINLFRFKNGNIEKIDPETYFAGCIIYQHDDFVIYEKDNLLFKHEPNDVSYEWRIADMNNKQHSSDLQKDKSGNIWVTSSKSVYGAKRKGVIMYNGNEWKPFISEWFVYYICCDKSGNIYANTLPEYGTANEESGVILKYDSNEWKQIASTGYFTIHKPNDPVSGKPTDPEYFYFPRTWFSCLQIDDNNNLWAGTLQRDAVGIEYGCGLDRMNLNGELMEKYTIKDFVIPSNPVLNIPSNSVVEVQTDKLNNVWIGMYSAGMAQLSADGKLQTVDFPEILEYLSIEHILIDENKIYGTIQMAGLVELR
jgi:hypothetical protein